MKQRTIRILAAVLCAALALSAASCGMIDKIKENARLNAEKTFAPTPEEAELVNNFNAALERSLADAEKAAEKTEMSFGKPTVTSETGDASALNASADMLKKLLTQEKPGNAERELTPEAFGEIRLRAVDAQEVPKTVWERNVSEHAVTDAKGKEETDEEGKVITEKKIKDDLLKTEFRFYTLKQTENAAPEGSDGAAADPDAPVIVPAEKDKEKGTPVPVDAAVIEKYFGSPRDRAEVLPMFDGVKEYLQVNDYTLEYKDCRIAAQTDLAAGRLTSVACTRNFAVTAKVTGAGPLAELGELTVTFDAAETVTYTFTYPAENNG